MDFDQLVDLSNRFSEHLALLLEDLPITASAHFPAAAAAALSLEHAGSLRLLFPVTQVDSAWMQYEGCLPTAPARA